MFLWNFFSRNHQSVLQFSDNGDDFLLYKTAGLGIDESVPKGDVIFRPNISALDFKATVLRAGN